MTERLVLVEGGDGGLRAALLVDGRLEAIEIDAPARPTRVGAVVQARVIRHAPGLGHILRLPDGTDALLDRGKGGTAPSDGDILPVQIVRDPRGQKLAAASHAIALTGRALVHRPLGSGIAISRKLGVDASERAVLESRLAGKPGGWILRRGAAQVDKEDLSAEVTALAIEAARLVKLEPINPPDAVRRLLADYGSPAPDRITVSGQAAEISAVAWCSDFAPRLLPRVERYDSPPELFDLHDLDSAIVALASPKVSLASGGSLVIERTEALTAVDVNAGAELNLLTVNLTAAAEIARQLRLRHVGGIVVIDFVTLVRPADRQRTLDALEVALADDPAQTYVLPMSRLGLVEMTRERRGPELTI